MFGAGITSAFDRYVVDQSQGTLAPGKSPRARRRLGSRDHHRHGDRDPRYWKFVDAFPMTVSGKAQKFRMREITTAELELARRGAPVAA